MGNGFLDCFLKLGWWGIGFKGLFWVEEGYLKGDCMKNKIGKKFMLINDNGKHVYMFHKGGLYKLISYNKHGECPYIFTSDYGSDRESLYRVTEKTFKKDMKECTVEEACSMKLVF